MLIAALTIEALLMLGALSSSWTFSNTTPLLWLLVLFIYYWKIFAAPMMISTAYHLYKGTFLEE
jgi:hypothetical protein